MVLSTAFAGRIIQLTDALDRFDAVSNQVCALDRLFREEGLDSVISSRWAHPDRDHLRLSREDLEIRDNDVLIVHFYGHSDGLEEWLKDQYCTKVILYHNVTPEEYFEISEDTFEFCKKGRSQLKEIIKHFNYFWGDSQFNVDELIALGASPEKSFVVPIVVESTEHVRAINREFSGQWIFVGRAVPNKRIVELIDLFAEMRRANQNVAKKLVLVGALASDDYYGRQISAAIKRSGCAPFICFTGKISDGERDSLLEGADIYVSLSEHEGFGVPLVEAAYFDLPVVALARAAVPETLGGNGTFATVKDMRECIAELANNGKARRILLAKQKNNAVRFTSGQINRALAKALAVILPVTHHFRNVSVVICTYNRRAHLERCLEYLTYQACDDFEVIVVNGPSDDGTAELLESYRGRIKIVENADRNLSKSRNLGIDVASCDIVAFIDDDALPFDDWIDKILQAYNSRPLTTAGLGGPAYYAGTFWFQAEDNGIDVDCQVKVNINSNEIGRDGWFRYNTGTNATFSRRHLQDINGFDEQYDYFLDESELCFRLQKSGNLIAFVPDIYVRHEFAQSHNRDGKFKYNWYTICKNTAYFIATNGKRQNADLKAFVDQRMSDERIAPLDAAVASGALSVEDRDSYVDAILKGAARGLADALQWPRTRAIAERPENFLRYETRFDRWAVGRDIAPLHICIVSKEAPPFAGSGGVGTLYYHLASELLLMGHNVSLIVPAGEESIHRQGRFSVYFTKPLAFSLPPMDQGFAGNVEWSLTALAKLAVIQKERPIDIVDSALWDAEALSFALLDPLTRPPLVVRLVTPYAISAELNEWHPSDDQLALFMEGERSLIGHADAVIPISNMIAASVAQKYGIESDARWSIGHCGIAHWPAFDVNEGYAEFPELGHVDMDRLQHGKLVVFVGRLERRKGIDLLLESAQSILDSDPEAFLIIAGRDPENWGLKIRATLRGTDAERFIALGEISNAAREKLLAHAYCVLFPSRYESFGLVPLEAFVHGVPVIASNAGAIPEVVIDEKSGLLFESGNSKAMTTAVVRMLSDDALRQTMSSNARARVKHLNARNSAVHSIEVYARLLKNKSLN